MKSNIRKLRNERNISQTDLGKIIGKTQQTVSHMEKDRDRIPIETLISLADYFEVSTDYILGIEDKKKPKDSSESISDLFKINNVKDETELLKDIKNGGNTKLLYELVLSMLLCLLEDGLQPLTAAKE